MERVTKTENIKCQIREIRLKKGITVEQMIKGTGISKASLWRYESGERFPDIKSACNL